MASRPPLLFVTYYRLVPTGQIGIFKRCLRLISELIDDYEIHLVNFGPLPRDDALFARLAPRISIHEVAGDERDGSLGDALEALLRRLAPAAAVIGESPLRGSMRLAHRVAKHLGLWQVGIDNYYGPLFTESLAEQWPAMSRWLLLGLAEGAPAGARRGVCEIVPPLIRFPTAAPDAAADGGGRAGNGTGARRGLCIIGYDKQTLLSGARLAAELLPAHRIDFLIAPRWRRFLERRGLDLEQDAVRVLEYPDDATIYASMSRACAIFGKAGFQQVVEGLALGAPVICQVAGGGLAPHLVAEHLRPWVRFVDDDGDGGAGQKLEAVLPELRGWLAAPPATPWQALRETVPDPLAHGAERLAALIAERTS